MSKYVEYEICGQCGAKVKIALNEKVTLCNPCNGIHNQDVTLVITQKNNGFEINYSQERFGKKEMIFVKYGMCTEKSLNFKINRNNDGNGITYNNLTMIIIIISICVVVIIVIFIVLYHVKRNKTVMNNDDKTILIKEPILNYDIECVK